MADFDLLVIGGGSGGVACARRAASYGARAAVIENDRLGGTCVHRGCIPKKLLVYASHFSHDFEDAAGYGWIVGERSFDWRAMVRAKVAELDRLEGIYERLLRDAGATQITGTGRLLDAHTAAVGDERHRAETIVIATGGRPTMPDIPGIELAVSSDEMFDLPAFPERLVIVGGGYIACEFACIMQGLGAQVTQLYRRDLPLRGFDYDLRAVLCEEMRKGGVDLRLNTNATSLAREGDAIAVATTTGETIKADQVLFATGRKPNVAGLGLENAGIATAEGAAVPVDAASHTGVAGIYAVGDVTDRINLTPVAIHEGRCIAETLYNDNPQTPDHRDIATAVFTTPELGTVGLSEEEARQAFPRGGHLQDPFPPAQAHAHRAGGDHLHEARRRPRVGPGGRLPHGGRRRGRSRAAIGCRRQGRRDQGPVRRDHGGAPDRGGGVRHHVRAGAGDGSPSRPGVRPASNNSGKMLARRAVRAYSTATTT